MISKEYRKMNAMMHERIPTYGTSGKKWAEIVHEICLDYETDDVLDYGAGKGTLAAIMDSRYDILINEYDPAIKEKSVMPDPADIVVCTDVLEHIEPQHVDEVISHIARLAKIAAFLVIATRPAKKTLPTGENAHLIIESIDWWEEKLLPYFEVIEKEKDVTEPGECVFLLEKRVSS